MPKVGIHITKKCFYCFFVAYLGCQSGSVVGLHCSYSLCMLQFLEIVGHEIVGNATVARPVSFIVLVYSHGGTYGQDSVAVVFRIDRSEFHVENDEQSHHQSNGKSRTSYIDGREELVLLHHRPCLFHVEFNHNFCFRVVSYFNVNIYYTTKTVPEL